ncbi:Laminin subunit gamma-3 [Bagarius yarrelli]|uniref:Laminin subunit gamma-3 n=1 Tax=Bagarius yarrelli TaxID=175774 RepID=A0A556UXX3_BAGYA|nr:Laminin subunit gamma-3 [Bagarius yarrelli]
MQRLKENLTRQANETRAEYLSVEEQLEEAGTILQNITFALPEQHKDINNTLLNSTSAERLSEADNMITRDTPLIQLTARTQGLRETALTSVVEGKKIESEAFTLHRQIEGLEKEWPSVRSQTRATLKREGILEQKVLTEVKKKVRHAGGVLRPALENATLARDMATQAQKTAETVAKDAKASLSQGKQMKKVASDLKASVRAVVRQLSEQENVAARTAEDVQDEADVSLKGVLGSMESARSQLEGFTHMLAELLNQIEKNTDMEKYDRLLNETAAHLQVLRGSVEGPALNRKFQILLGAAEVQEKQLMELEKNLQDIQEERDSLTDIAQNLPKTCPERK